MTTKPESTNDLNASSEFKYELKIQHPDGHVFYRHTDNVKIAHKWSDRLQEEGYTVNLTNNY